MARARDRGESLVEVVCTIVIISLAVTALMSSLTAAANSSQTHRRVQVTDVAVRDYAEAFKSATASCAPGAAYVVNYTPPTGYTATFTADDGQPGVCPAATALQLVTLVVAQPTGITHSMRIAVRTP